MSEKEDIEMSFVRMSSVNGLVLGGNITASDKRERIRRAILENRLKNRPYNDQISYGEAYRRCYFGSLAMSRGDPDHVAAAEEPDFTISG